jgi:hypothetical protein
MLISTIVYAQKYPANDPMCRNNQFNCTYEPKAWKGTVEIIPDPKTNEICNNKMGTNDPGVVSCATQYNNGALCIIYVLPKTSMALIGHELRHCAEGAWH